MLHGNLSQQTNDNTPFIPTLIKYMYFSYDTQNPSVMTRETADLKSKMV